jgi:hypothetical protein
LNGPHVASDGSAGKNPPWDISDIVKLIEDWKNLLHGD